MTISHCDWRNDMRIFSHIGTKIPALTKGAGYPGWKCANQLLSAGLCTSLLGMQYRSVSVTPCIRSNVRDNWKGRAVITALMDRRRQSCLTPSKPSWPLACSPFLQHVRSKKSPWKSPWSWKSLLWRSSNLELLSPGQQARHADSRHTCPQLKRYSHLACSFRSQLATFPKKPSWSNRLWKKTRRTSFVFWPGALSVRPKLFPASCVGAKPC